MKNNYVDFSQFEDEYGNIKREFEVICYHKLSDGTWTVHKRFDSGRLCYEIDGKLYLRVDNNLITLNMDFESDTCHACYQVGKEITNRKKITGNAILFTCRSTTQNVLTLHKQSYSDGTCFYTLKDGYGHFKTHHASHNIDELIQQVKKEKEIYEQELHDSETKDNDSIKRIYEDLISWKQEIIDNMIGIKAA
jgi:hypothetical protein